MILNLRLNVSLLDLNPTQSKAMEFITGRDQPRWKRCWSCNGHAVDKL